MQVKSLFFCNFLMISSSEISSPVLFAFLDSYFSITVFRRCILSIWRSSELRNKRRIVRRALPCLASLTTSNEFVYIFAPSLKAFFRFLFREFKQFLHMYMSIKEIPEKECMADSVAFGGSLSLSEDIYRYSFGNTDINIICSEK